MEIMPTHKQLERVKELLKTIPKDAQVVFDEELNDDGDWQLEPITVSCSDTTIVGYIVTNKGIEH